MMSLHFRLSSELSGAIAKDPHMPKISFLCLTVSSINSLQIYIYIYSARTKVFDHHRNRHTNSFKVGLFIKEYVLKLQGILHFLFRKLHILITHN